MKIPTPLILLLLVVVCLLAFYIRSSSLIQDSGDLVMDIRVDEPEDVHPAEFIHKDAQVSRKIDV